MGWKWPGIFHVGVPHAGLSHLHPEPQLSHLFCLGLSALRPQVSLLLFLPTVTTGPAPCPSVPCSLLGDATG